MATNGTPITNADLTAAWAPVLTIRAKQTSNRDNNISSFQWDGVSQDTILVSEDPIIRLWTPSVDVSIVGIIVYSQDGFGTYNVTLEGNINSTITSPLITAGTNVRTQVILPAGRFGVLAGDTVRIKLNPGSITTELRTARVHILTNAAWSRI